MNYFASVLLMIGMAGAQGPEYVDKVGGDGWIAGICTRGIPDESCPFDAKMEMAKDTVCTYRCVHHPKPAPKPVARKKVKPKFIEAGSEPWFAGGNALGTEPPSGYVRHEPLDVPAIQETRKDEPNCSRSYIAGSSDDGWAVGRMNGMAVCGNVQTSTTRLTCADKKRVLLTSEDGIKHCIKF